MNDDRPHTAPGAANRGPRRAPRRPRLRVVARFERTVLGVLPRSRRVLAANDPEA